MKKLLYSTFALLAITFLSQCDPKTSETPVPAGKYDNGTVILNEGNFSQSNGNLSFYNFNTKELLGDIIKSENNNTALNALVQNAVDSDAKTFIVTNSPDQLVVAARTTFKVEGVATGLANPYDVAIANNKAYVTQWGANYYVGFNDPANYANAAIKVISTTTRQVVATIPVGKEVNGVIALNNRVYAAATGKNEVWVINSTTDAVETVIPVASQPNAIEVDANGKLWVLCSSGNLVRINPSNNTVETTITTVSVAGYNEKITTNATRTKLYWLGSTTTGFTGAGIFAMDITATAAPTTPLVAGTKFYGIGFSGFANQIVAGVAPNFSGNGEVNFYNTDGSLASTISSNGIAPNGFLFR